MGEIEAFTEEKLVIGVLVSRKGLLNPLKEKLVEEFGVIDYESPIFLFDFSHYYDREMGTPIYRLFYSFRDLVDTSLLWRIKVITNKIEEEFVVDGGRKINLDPGLMALSRFVLASTKENSHRIPLNNGIYAEITLMFERGSFRPVEWTYPDYKSDRYIEILGKIRGIYKRQIG